MARVPIDQRTPLAQWLIRARETRDSGSDRYTVARFLADLRAEEGSAPDPSTYAQWESGAVTPRQSNLEPLIRFWAARGVAGLGERPALPADPLIAALNAQTKAIADLAAALNDDREERQALTRAIAALARSLAMRSEAVESPEPSAPQRSMG